MFVNSKVLGSGGSSAGTHTAVLREGRSIVSMLRFSSQTGGAGCFRNTSNDIFHLKNCL